jgi:hypothetical protein
VDCSILAATGLLSVPQALWASSTSLNSRAVCQQSHVAGVEAIELAFDKIIDQARVTASTALRIVLSQNSALTASPPPYLCSVEAEGAQEGEGYQAGPEEEG